MHFIFQLYMPVMFLLTDNISFARFHIVNSKRHSIISVAPALK